jgi:tetratricopeptide (TPR) repeat protein
MSQPSSFVQASRIALLLAIAGVALCLAQQPSPKLAKELQDGLTFLRNREFPAAAETYQKVLQTDPHSEKAALGLAAAYYGLYNYDQTRRVLRKSAAAHPRSAAALVELGKLDIHLLHYDDAIVALNRALQRDPRSAPAHEQLGVAFMSKGIDDKALEHLNEAIRLAPGSSSAYYFRASLYADRIDNDRAYQDAKEAHRLEPNAQTQLLLAKTALHAGKCVETVELLQPLAESKPPDPAHLYLLSRAYKCAGQPQRAQELLDEFEKQSQSAQDAKTRKLQADHLATEAGELARKNQVMPAIDLLGQALAEDPENGPALAQLAKIDFSRGEISKAQEEITSALRGDPYNPDYLYVRGKVLESTDPAGAVQAFRETVLVDPKESDAYYEMGEIYSKMGKRNEAAQALRKAIELSPGDPDYKKALADLGGKHTQ